MPMLEPTNAVPGVPLPFRTYEGDPARAVLRGFALLRLWCRAKAIVPSRHVCRVAAAAAAVAGSPSGGAADAALLADYSTFVRLTASMWQVRRQAAFVDLVSQTIATADEKNFAHDECVLFLAAKLRASGMAVLPPSLGGHGVTNPDLHLPGGAQRGGDVFFEVKEREPAGNRSRKALATYVRRKIHECSEQMVARHARGFGFVDLGIVEEQQIPAWGRAIDEALRRHPALYGVMVSGTLLKLLKESQGAFFVPVFRSHMKVTPDVYQGRDRLNVAARLALHAAFAPR